MGKVKPVVTSFNLPNPSSRSANLPVFNFFIVLPEIIASLFFGKFMDNVLHNDRLMAVQIGGGLLIAAGLLCALIVKEQPHEELV